MHRSLTSRRARHCLAFHTQRSLQWTAIRKVTISRPLLSNQSPQSIPQPTASSSTKPAFTIDPSAMPQWLADFCSEYKQTIHDSADPKSNTYEIRLFPSPQWNASPFEFHPDLWNPNEMTSVHKRRLCLGDESKTHTLIGEAFAFPAAEDHPIIHEANTPAKLWWDNSSKTPKILIQLSQHFPPLLWLGIVPRLDALKKTLEAFLQVDSQCMQRNLKEAESSHERFLKQLGADADTIADKKHQLKDLYLNELRQKPPSAFAVDWENDTCVYVGSHESMAALERTWMRSNPFVFGWPLLVSEGNPHMENRSTQLAAFRTLLSKSIILIANRRDLQVNTQSLIGKNQKEKKDLEVADELTMETPVFLFVNYAKNARLTGGEAFVKRFNSVMGTSLPTDLPVDVLAVLCRETTCRTGEEVLAEARLLDSAIRGGSTEVERHPRLPSLLHSSTRAVGHLAYNIMYLGCMQYPAWEVVYATFVKHPEGTVRLALAKASMVLQRPELVRSLVEQEKDESIRESLQKVLDDDSQKE